MTDTLAISLRPKRWQDLIGQEAHVVELKKRFINGNIPHFYIFSGPVGSGKTTFGRMLAIMLQKDPTRFSDMSEMDHEKYNYDIKEINAANKTSIDDVRQLIEDLHYLPLYGKSKIVIMDEAHQLSKSAQDALLKDTEDIKKHVFIIFCTSALTKLSEALRSRACIMVMRPLTTETTRSLLSRAAKVRGFQKDMEPLVTGLEELSVTSPRWVLQAAEKFFCGVNAEDSILLSDSGPIEIFQLCRTVASGNWKECVPYISKLTKADVTKVQAAILGYLTKMMFNSNGDRLLNICKAIDYMSRCPMDTHCSLPAFVASIGVACEYLKVKKVVSKTTATKTM